MAEKLKQTNVLRDMQEGFTAIYLVLMVGIFPFYFQNNYINIVLAKKSFFQAISIPFLLLILIFGFLTWIKERRNRNRGKRISLTDIFAILFLVVILVSCLISPAGNEAFWGNEGRMLGGFFLILCLGVYFAVSRFYQSNGIFIWVFLLANLGMSLIVVLHFWGLDVLHMHENLVKNQQTYFMGTMGNININAGYFGVVTAVMMGLYYMSQEKLSRICFWWMTVLGIYCCYCSRSDSWLLAVGGALLILLSFAMKNVEKQKKWWKLCVGFFSGTVAMKWTEVVDRAVGWENLFIKDLREQTLLSEMISIPMLLLQVIFLLLFFSLIHSRFEKVLETYGNKLLLCIVVLGVIAVLVWIFPLEDSFGTNRGYIWKRTILNFKEAPMMQKLFGYGPNCFLKSMEESFGAEMRARYVNPFLDAHNEALQFLAVTGILGMVSYLGMQISLLICCIRQKMMVPGAVIGAVGIAAYLLLGTVNNPQVFTTPLFFCFLGMIENRIQGVRPPVV